jgi:hypothetical protein
VGDTSRNLQHMRVWLPASLHNVKDVSCRARDDWQLMLHDGRCFCRGLVVSMTQLKSGRRRSMHGARVSDVALGLASRFLPFRWLWWNSAGWAVLALDALPRLAISIGRQSGKSHPPGTVNRCAKPGRVGDSSHRQAPVICCSPARDPPNNADTGGLFADIGVSAELHRRSKGSNAQALGGDDKTYFLLGAYCQRETNRIANLPCSLFISLRRISRLVVNAVV